MHALVCEAHDWPLDTDEDWYAVTVAPLAIVWLFQVQDALVTWVVDTVHEEYWYEEEPESVPLIQVLDCEEHVLPEATVFAA